MEVTTLKLLKDIKKNNNRPWFEKNRDRVEAAKADFESFIILLLKDLYKIDKRLSDLAAKECIYRIYRDVRFSKNKDPYKSNLSASISPGGKNAEIAGIYIHIEPGKSFIAGGRWMPAAPALKAIRQEIKYHTHEWKKITGSKNFKDYFGELENIKLKLAPKGYDKTDPEIELYKYTSYIVSHNIPDEEILSPSLVKTCTKAYKVILPFLDFLNRNIS